MGSSALDGCVCRHVSQKNELILILKSGFQDDCLRLREVD